MKVSELMTRKLITVSPDESVEKAVQLFRERSIRHLLVLENDRLVGIVSDRDLMHAMEPVQAKKKRLLNVGGLFFLLEPLEVREIMSRDVKTIAPDLSVQDAAAYMVASRFGALPVVDNDTLVGIITETDLLRYFAKSAPEFQQEGKTRQRPKSERRR
jgi:acetoin utilization protein AcuB